MQPILKGKVALVTGASDGLGAATVRLFARAGAQVVATARRQERLQLLAEIVARDGGIAHPEAADLSQDSSVAALIAASLEQFGRIDFVINIGGSAGAMGVPLWQVTPADWTAVAEANIAGPLNLIRHALPHMLERGDGRMLFLSSSATVRPVALSGAYTASKAAVNAMVATLPLEIGAAEVAFNTFNPGPIDTPTFQQVMRELNQPQAVRRSAQQPEQAAILPLWLCADETWGVTGQFVQWKDADVRPRLDAFGAQLQLADFG